MLLKTRSIQMGLAEFVEGSTKNKTWRVLSSKYLKISIKEFSWEEPWCKLKNKMRLTFYKLGKSMGKSCWWKRQKDGNKIHNSRLKLRTCQELSTLWNSQQIKIPWKSKSPICKSCNRWLLQRRFEMTFSRKSGPNKTETLSKSSSKTTSWNYKTFNFKSICKSKSVWSRTWNKSYNHKGKSLRRIT